MILGEPTMSGKNNVIELNQYDNDLNTDEVYQEVRNLFINPKRGDGATPIAQPYSIKAGRLLVGTGGKVLDIDFESCTQLGCNFVDKLKQLESDELYWKDLFSQQVTDAIVSLDFDQILKQHRHHEIEGVKLTSASGMNLFAKISIWAVEHGNEQYAVVLVSDAKRKSHFDNINKLVLSDSVSDYASSLIWSFKDIFEKMDSTQSRGLELLLFEMANIDVLTSLPNRKMFLRLLQKSIDETTEHELNNFGVCLVKLNNIDQINDQYGLETGDAVISELARKLKTVLRSSDLLARVDGTTFSVALPAVNSKANLKIVADRILNTLSSVALDAKKMPKISIGMAMLSDHENTLNQLMNESKKALDKATKLKNNAYKIYE